MTKHGASHAGATLVSIVAGGLLVGQVEDYLPWLGDKLHMVSSWIVDTFELDWTRETVSQLLIALVLAFVWGMAFKQITSRRSQKQA